MKINLLPPKVKAELFEDEIKKLIIILGILILVFLLSLTVILFSVRTYISTQLSSIQSLVNMEKERLGTPELQGIKEEIIAANKDLLKLNSFYQEQIDITNIFEKISEIMPSQMYLTNFSYQKDNLQVSLSGYAPNSELLLEFKKDLEKEFPDPYFPPQNWIKSTDIDFQVRFNIVKK
jgi:Tfp pilus assembly protein PilN